MHTLFNYVQSLVSARVLIRLDNGATIRGFTISIDDHCNVLLVDCTYKTKQREQTLDEALIRGNHILFLTKEPPGIDGSAPSG